MAKHHMLGNIKFIGELYRLDILQESILHKCIKQLIQKKRKGTVDDLAEDLECLCQIMTTCGRRLDHEKAKSLMDQYFDRLNHLHKKRRELPSRVRFMLQDVMELRMENWTPRNVKVSMNQGPKTLGQIRSDLAVDYPALLVDTKSRQGHVQMGRSKQFENHNQYFPSSSGLGFFPMTKKQQYNGFSAPLSPPLPAANDGGSSSPGSGFDFFSTPPQPNRPSTHPMTNGGFPRAPSMPPALSHTNGKGTYANQYTGPFSQPHYPRTYNGYSQPPQTHRTSPTNTQYTRGQQSRPDPSPIGGPAFPDRQKEIPHRFARHTPSPPSGEKEGGPLVKTGKLCYPPKPSNDKTKSYSAPMTQQTKLFKPGAGADPSASPRRQPLNFRGVSSPAKGKSKPPPPATAETFQPPFQHVIDNAKKSSNRKSAVSNNDKQKGRKSLGEKEAKEISKKIVTDFLNGEIPVHDTVLRVKGAGLAEKHMTSLVGMLAEKSLFGDDESRAMTCQLLDGLRSDNVMLREHVIEGLQGVFEKLTSLEAELPRIASITASLLARIVTSDLVTFKAVGERLVGGYHFPLFLLTLQQMIKLKDRAWMSEAFNASGLVMREMMPEVSRANKDMLEILNGKQLGFLLPLLKMEAELTSQLDANPSPTVVYRWIRDNVDANLHIDPDFINILVTCSLNFITKKSSLAPGTDRTQSASKSVQEEERKLLSGIKPLLQKFIHDSSTLQLHALYAVQVFCHNSNFPKGLMLRLFNLLYHEDVIDEETFILWKEDFNDKFPGKGKSLFQVNSWLTWLQEADTEDDDEEA